MVQSVRDYSYALRVYVRLSTRYVAIVIALWLFILCFAPADAARQRLETEKNNDGM